MYEKITRKKYDKGFKQNAVNLCEEPGQSVPKVAKSLGISENMLYRWRNECIKNGKLAFPGKGHEALTDEQKRFRELEKRLADAEMERDILKKAVGIFSRVPK